MVPIELRVNNHDTHYTVDKVWPGVGNVSFGQRKFTTLRDVRTWCDREWPGVPVIRN